MTIDEFHVPENDEEIMDLLLDHWEDALDRGEKPDPELICREHPHLLQEFQSKIALLGEVNGNLADESKIKPPDPAGGPESIPSSRIEWNCQIDQFQYHAHGGLGIVFRGFEKQLHRDLAIKFIRKQRRHNPIDIQRFRVEAEITGRLDHPGVVPVHGFGKTDNGVPFYAMRMVDGDTLQKRIDQHYQNFSKHGFSSEQSLEFRKLLTSFISVCNTIEYAHTRGVINCDIKPGNIMLGKYGETVVLDWGCARYVGSKGRAKSVGELSLKPNADSGSSTSSGSTGGTPIYMSPEQHTQSESLGPSSDIYSLGVTLYRLITGVPAFPPDHSLPKIREDVIRGRFRKPRDLRPAISKALEAICLKAMALSPEHRYATAGELAQDLERYLGDEEVEAYTEPVSRRLARMMRRHRGISQVLILSAGTLILFTSIFAFLMGQSVRREALARFQATELRDQSLMVAARSAATSMALRINDAWRILEIESNSDSMRSMMIEHGSQVDPYQWKGLQDWLVRQASSHQQATTASSWFLCNADGVQIARYPLRDDEGNLFESIGKSYAYRDYFHGNGTDLNPGELGSPQHINEVHLSAAYKSSNKNDAMLKVAFSIPIWDNGDAGNGDRTFLGVLGYSVELGQFAVLQDSVSQNQQAETFSLVDMRKPLEDDSPAYGLILQHPSLDSLLKDKNPTIRELKKLDQGILKSIELYRSDRLKQIREFGFKAPTEDVIRLEQFRDPYLDNRDFIAACEPVCVVPRSGRAFNTGWIVIVQGFKTN